MTIELNGAAASIRLSLTWIHQAAGELLVAPHDPHRTIEIANAMRQTTRALARMLSITLED